MKEKIKYIKTHEFTSCALYIIFNFYLYLHQSVHLRILSIQRFVRIKHQVDHLLLEHDSLTFVFQPRLTYRMCLLIYVLGWYTCLIHKESLVIDSRNFPPFLALIPLKDTIKPEILKGFFEQIGR